MQKSSLLTSIDRPVMVDCVLARSPSDNPFKLVFQADQTLIEQQMLSLLLRSRGMHTAASGDHFLQIRPQTRIFCEELAANPVIGDEFYITRYSFTLSVSVGVRIESLEVHICRALRLSYGFRDVRILHGTLSRSCSCLRR